MKRILALLLVLAFCASAVWAAPTATITADKKKLNAADSAVLTVTVANDTTPRTNAVVTYTAPAPLTIQSATGPKIISNQATATWDGGTATSNTVYLRVVGATQAVAPVGSTVTIPLGDLDPSDSVSATVTVRNP